MGSECLYIKEMSCLSTNFSRIEMSAAVAQVGIMAAIMAAAGTSALGALAGVGIQMGITAAIDSKNGGAAATQAMQSGHMDSTTKQYQALVGNSLLFISSI